MSKEKYMNNLIKECDEILHTCLFDKDNLDSNRVARCMSELVQALSYFNGKRYEDQTCKNCKHHEPIEKAYKLCGIMEIGTSDDFGCILFEEDGHDR